jgi:hypothetical protein
MLDHIHDNLHSRKWIPICLAIMFSLALIVACQPGEQSGGEPTQAPAEAGTSLADPVDPVDPADPADPADSSAEEASPDQIIAAWGSSPHADSYVVTAEGMNSSCARCHAPVNWIPTMDEIPESCLTCKFEVDPPPPLIEESVWTHVECKVCHQMKKDEVEPGFAWLEIAPIDEYAEVASTTELCNKCHIVEGIPAHVTIAVEGDHAGMLCTECHDAHDTQATCSTSGCHEDALSAGSTTPGHDEDHKDVHCVACHDAGELNVGPVEGEWTTLMVGEPDQNIPFISHNVVLEAPCERCHFNDNPWGLSVSVSVP